VRDYYAAIDLVLHEDVNGDVYNLGGHNDLDEFRCGVGKI
jgi:hypothetical protein